MTAAKGGQITGKLTEQFTVVKMKQPSKSLKCSIKDRDEHDSKLENKKLKLCEFSEINNNVKSKRTKKSMAGKDHGSKKKIKWKQKRQKIDKDPADQSGSGENRRTDKEGVWW